MLLVGGVSLAPDLRSGEEPTEVLHVLPTGEVRRLDATLPYGLVSAAVVAVGDVAYVFGGQPDGGEAPSDRILRIDPVADEVRVLEARLPTGRLLAAAASDGSVVHLFGGVSRDGPLTDVLRFDPRSEEVETRSARLPTSVHHRAAVWDGARVHLLGGLDAGVWSDEVLLYDPTADAFDSKMRRLPTPLRGAGVASDGAHAYLLGGNLGTEGHSAEILRYHFASGSVDVMAAALPQPRAFGAAAWTGDAVLLVGGTEIEPGQRPKPDGGVFRYSPGLDAVARTLEAKEGALPEQKEAPSLAVASVLAALAVASVLGARGRR